MPYVERDGVRIHYRVEGSGVPLVLHHGFTSRLDRWYENGYVEALQDRYRLILIDARGHGKSDKPHEPAAYQTERRVADVLAVMDAVGIELTDGGFVGVDDRLRTSVDGYYAIGDIAGPPMLAHKGSREGMYVAELLAGHSPAPIKYDNIPSVTYCHPEVASVGLTEDQCKERSLEYAVGRFPFSANGRARASRETDGFVKIIRDKQYGEILGAHIVASHASELIHELVVARENEYTVEELHLAEQAADGVLLVEWPERAIEVLPPEHLLVVLETVPKASEERRITLVAIGERYHRVLDGLGARR